eukprot:scaffold249706_cov37-Tisochrysis_lutea.AAC.4
MLAVALTAASALVVPMPVRLQPAHVPLARLGFPAMQAPAAAYSPAKEVSARGGKYYEGRTPEMSKAIKQALKEVGTRKICVVTGASSGLGLSCVQSLLRDYEVRRAGKGRVRECTALRSARPIAPGLLPHPPGMPLTAAVLSVPAYSIHGFRLAVAAPLLRRDIM